MAMIKELFDFIVEHKEPIISIITIAIALLIMNAFYDGWNTMWHDFGKNLYHFFNDN